MYLYCTSTILLRIRDLLLQLMTFELYIVSPFSFQVLLNHCYKNHNPRCYCLAHFTFEVLMLYWLLS